MGLKGYKSIKRLRRRHYQLLSETYLATFKPLMTLASLVSRLKRRHYQLLSKTSLASLVSRLMRRHYQLLSETSLMSLMSLTSLLSLFL